MDLRAYYQKIRKIEADVPGPAAVVVSRETPDGGRAGVKTEVPRGLAARLVAEEKADLATPEEAEEFRAKAAANQRIAQEMAASSGRPPHRKG
jgi:hypothetical protein